MAAALIGGSCCVAAATGNFHSRGSLTGNLGIPEGERRLVYLPSQKFNITSIMDGEVNRGEDKLHDKQVQSPSAAAKPGSGRVGGGIVGSPPSPGRSSVGEELAFDLHLPRALGGIDEHEDDDPTTSASSPLDMDSVLRFFSRETPESLAGPLKYQVFSRLAGTGLAPWEIHRPQQFVRELLLRRDMDVFRGRILDAGCGIGDNALYIARACPAAQVTAVDVVPRCLGFCAAKARLRGMQGRVTLVAADLTAEYDSLPEGLRSEPYDVVLDSGLFHTLSDAERQQYMRTLRLLVRPGGLVLLHAASELETRPGGGPIRRLRVADVESVFTERHWWLLEEATESSLELHPSCWNGSCRSRLYTVRRL
ncbi:hypothetical protein PLESTM_002099200 [Pleodorina starrii]|nr:hypothetical protein PLESTM_002099200 [Pleodorina starrii]